MRQLLNSKLAFIGLLVLILLVVLGLVFQSQSKPDYTKKTVDKDTGEILIDQPNKAAERGGSSNQIIILGSTQLIQAGMTQDQFLLVKGSLQKYANENLKNKYTTLKILSEGFDSDGTSITGKLKLGDKGPSLNLKITFSQLKYVQVFITSNQSSLEFDSGKMEVMDKTPSESGHEENTSVNPSEGGD